jgi:hypothetical protein
MRKDTFKGSGGSLNTTQLYAVSDRVREIGHIEDEVMSPRDDNFTEGISSGIVASDAGSGVLSLTSGVFYHTNSTSGFLERVVFAGDTIDLSSEADDTYYVYLISQEDIVADSYPNDKYLPPADLYHRHLDYSEVLSYSTNSGESKIKVCSVTIASGLITAIDSTFRTRYGLTNALEYQVDEKISQRILDIDEDPIINILNSPPGSPSDTDRYIVDSSPTGAWVGHSDDVATYDSGSSSWLFNTPVEGTTVWNQTSNSYVFYDGAAWVDWEGKISFDEIPDGTNYGKVRTVPVTQLNSAGNANTVLLRESTGGYADTTYGKVTNDHLDYIRHRSVTLVVAASDSSTAGKESADYVCDGTADEVEINAAITVLNGLGGGKLVLLEGTYVLASEIDVVDNITLEGMGYNTYIRNYGILGTGINNLVIQNLRIACFLSGSTVNLTSSTDITIKDCYIDSSSQACIKFQTSITRAYVYNNALRMLATSQPIISAIGGDYNKFINNYLDGGNGTGVDGIYITSTNSIMSGNNIIDVVSDAINTSGNYNIISNNNINCNNNSGSKGIVNTGSYCNIQNNNMNNCGDYGLTSDGDYVTISGNYIEDVDTYDGIINISGSDYCKIDGNTVYTCARYGINNVGQYTSINNNNIYDCTNNGIDNNGTDCTINSNIIINCDDGINNSSQEVVINGNNISDSGSIGINSTATYCKIIGNKVRDSTSEGIYNTGNYSVVSTNNSTNNGVHGIYNNGTNCTINSNVSSFNTNYGISNGASGDYCTIVANMVRSNTGGSYIDNGASTQVSLNVT